MLTVRKYAEGLLKTRPTKVVVCNDTKKLTAMYQLRDGTVFIKGPITGQPLMKHFRDQTQIDALKHRGQRKLIGSVDTFEYGEYRVDSYIDGTLFSAAEIKFYTEDFDIELPRILKPRTTPSGHANE